MTTILVTGGAGFVGSNLVDAIPQEHSVVVYDNLLRGKESRDNLLEIGRPYSFIEGDVRDYDKVSSVVENSGVTLIYHLAALPSHRLVFTKPPLEYITVDLMGTMNVLDAARRTGAKVVFASSNKVYGHQQIPFRESMPKIPEGVYGQSKASSEDFMRQFAKYYGVNSVAIRFHHAVGARCHSELVLPIFAERALKNEPLIANGRWVKEPEEKGTQWQYCAADFTNINDVVRGLLLFVERKWDGFEFYNFGTGKMWTVKELADMVVESANSKSKIVDGTAMEHEGLQHLADVKKAKSVLGFEAKIPLRQSVDEFIAWRKHRTA